MVRWYRDVLGFRSLLRVVEDGYAVLASGHTRLVLIARDAPGSATRRLSLAVEAANLPELLTRLTSAGSEVSPVKENPEGLQEVSTSDPDGNRVRFFVWPD